MISTELIQFSTVSELAEQYTRSVERITELLTEIEETQQQLKRLFNCGYGMQVRVTVQGDPSPHDINEQTLGWIQQEFKRSAWKTLLDRLEIHKVMSAARSNELKKLLHYRGKRYDFPDKELKQLPDITTESAMSVLGGFAASANDFLEENIQETLCFLRPRSRRLKTNSPFLVNEKVILSGPVQRVYCTERFRVSSSYEAQLQQLDQIFHFLDGAGLIREFHSPLINAINSGSNPGETAYFQFRCFGNGNLHLKFLRKDLLKKLNSHSTEKNLDK